MTKVETPHWGCALTGSGHVFKECVASITGLQNVDLFVSKAPVSQFDSGVYRPAVARATSSTLEAALERRRRELGRHG
jgi:hypothetical protein